MAKAKLILIILLLFIGFYITHVFFYTKEVKNK